MTSYQMSKFYPLGRFELIKPEAQKWLELGNLDWVEEAYSSQPNNWDKFVEEVYDDVVKSGGYDERSFN